MRMISACATSCACKTTKGNNPTKKKFGQKHENGCDCACAGVPAAETRSPDDKRCRLRTAHRHAALYAAKHSSRYHTCVRFKKQTKRASRKQVTQAPRMTVRAPVARRQNAPEVSFQQKHHSAWTVIGIQQGHADRHGFRFRQVKNGWSIQIKTDLS